MYQWDDIPQLHGGMIYPNSMGAEKLLTWDPPRPPLRISSFVSFVIPFNKPVNVRASLSSVSPSSKQSNPTRRKSRDTPDLQPSGTGVVGNLGT